MMSPEINTRLQVAAVWFLCTILFGLSDLLAEPIDQGDWASYLNLIVMVAWFCTSLPLAIGVVIAGVALASAVRMRMSTALKLPPLSQTEILKHAVSRILISGASVTVAAGVYGLLHGTLPLNIILQENTIALIAALGAGFLSTQLIGVSLARIVHHVNAKPIWSSGKRGNWFSELSLFPLIVTMPLILFNAGLGAFTVIMSIVGAHAVRYRQIGMAVQDSKEMYQQSSELVQKLSLVNRSVQNAMFNVDQQEAVKTACQTAIAITQADKVAIFLINREQEDLYLAEHVA
jgi:hypothetical protein